MRSNPLGSSRSRSSELARATSPTSWDANVTCEALPSSTRSRRSSSKPDDPEARSVAEPKLPSFDLVVATVDRSEELRMLLGSLERQTDGDFRVLVVDQNDDGRIDGVL